MIGSMARAVALSFLVTALVGCVVVTDDDEPCTSADNVCDDPWYLTYCATGQLWTTDCQDSCTTDPAGAPVGVGDNPNQALVNFLALRSENPFRGGKALITFGITRKEKVELKVYDVAGRLVKTLVNREIEPGEHKVFWDGTANDGRLVSRGVYFYQLRTPSYVSQKKLAVLQN